MVVATQVWTQEDSQKEHSIETKKAPLRYYHFNSNTYMLVFIKKSYFMYMNKTNGRIRGKLH